MMEEERIRIIQGTSDANYVYAVRDKRHRDGISLYSRKYMLRELKGRTWCVQLMETDGTFNSDSHVFYEGSDADEVLQCVLPNWGIWSLKEIIDKNDEMEKLFQSTFGETEPRQYIISLNEIL